VTPAASATCTHGRTFASWSSRDTTTSSPGRHDCASVRATTYVRAVALGPKTTPSGRPPTRSATAARAAETISPARRPGSKATLRLATARRSVPATASMTGAAAWVPAAPSRWAKPSARAG
jgi:hypothetical protein